VPKARLANLAGKAGLARLDGVRSRMKGGKAKGRRPPKGKKIFRGTRV